MSAPQPAIVQQGNAILGLPDGSITTSTNVFTTGSDVWFNAWNPGVGSNITIRGAGAAGADLATTIATIATTSHITTAANAGTTVVNNLWTWGTVPSGSNWTTTLTLTFASAMNAGDLVVVTANWDPSQGDPTISDTSGNVYVGLTTTNNASLYKQKIFYCLSCKAASAGANVLTLTWGALVNAAMSCSFAEFSLGGGTATKDQFVGATGLSAAPSSGNVTPTFPNQIQVAQSGITSHVTAGQGGWVNPALDDGFGDMLSYRFTTSIAAVAGTFTQATSDQWVASIVTFAVHSGLDQSEPLTPPRRLPTAPFEPGPEILQRLTAAAPSSIGWMPTDVSPRGKSKPHIVEDPITKDTAPFGVQTIGWMPVDPTPNRQRRAPVSDDSSFKVLATAALASLGWIGDEPLPSRRPRPPLESETGSTQTVTLTGGWASDDVALAPRKRPPPEDPPFPLTATKPPLSLGWIPVEVQPRERTKPPIQEDPLLKTFAPSLTSIGWIPSDTVSRERAKTPVQEDPPLDPRGLPSIGWVSVDTQPRERTKPPAIEDPTLTATKPLLSLGWIPIDVQPRERTKPPVQEDPLVKSLTAPTLPSVGWVSVDVAPREKTKPPVQEDPLLKATAPFVASSVGWMLTDVLPRERTKLPVPEDPAIEPRFVSISNLGWMPSDTTSRGRTKPPVQEDPILRGLPTVLPSIGWVGVDTQPRERAKTPPEFDLPLTQIRIDGLGWVSDEVIPRRKPPAVAEADLPLKGTLPSIGWASVDVQPRERAKPPVPEDAAIQTLHVVVLPSIGWIPAEVSPRERAKPPVPEDPTVESAHIVILTSIGWMPSDVASRVRPPLSVFEETPLAPLPPVPPPPPPPAPAGGSGGGTFAGGVQHTGGFGGGGVVIRRLKHFPQLPPSYMAELERNVGDDTDELDDDTAELASETGSPQAQPLPKTLAGAATALPKTAQPFTRALWPPPGAARPLPKTTAELRPPLPKTAVELAAPLPKTLGAPSTALPKTGWVIAGALAAAVGAYALFWDRPAPTRPRAHRAISRRSAPPPHATVQERYVRCGKPNCTACPHGPYYYAYYRNAQGKVRKKYLGTKPR